MEKFKNDYGYFSDDGREYVITRPDTPMPWINVISNGDYGLTVSQAGSGYSWRTHASLNRITRWDQDLVRDEWGKYVYIRDADTGEFWSPTWQPCGSELDQYRVRHGMGYSTIEARHGTLETELTLTVPSGAPCELWLLHLHNRSERSRRLQLFTYLEWLLGAAPDWHREFHRLFVETSYNAEHGTLLATKVLWDLPAEAGPHWNTSWPYVAFHTASVMPAGFDASKRAFVGRHGRLAAPSAVRTGASTNNSGRWDDPIGSLQVEVALAPGEAAEVVFTLGAADSREEALALAERYREPAAARAALGEVRELWRDLLDGLVVETPDAALNVMGNIWLPYQAIAGRLWGRTAYYQTGGAFGFRDQLQDSLVWLLVGKPERTLEQIRLHARHQFREGVVLHWWHPLAETGLKSRYSDDLLWLPFAVLYYLHETADTECLAEEVAFYDGGSASLLEHCLRAFAKALERRSERGLPLILEGDWNDGLNATGDEGRGESVWMAHFLYFLLTRWAELPVLDVERQESFRAEADALRAAVNTHGWDGEWYWRASTDERHLLGSAANEEGRIFLNAQTWAVLSGTADPERAEQVMEAAREHLFTRYGALLLTPGYSVPNPEVGYLSRYAPGTRENGGVYVHASCWAVIAERQQHGPQAAYDLWRTFCPVLRGEEPDTYEAEPYVMPGNVDGPRSDRPGRGGWTWYTGSGQWTLRAMVEGVLGIEACWGGLRVRGELPDGWPQMRIRREFRGATYEITVRRAAAGETPGRWLDGQSLATEIVPLTEGEEHTMEIVV